MSYSDLAAELNMPNARNLNFVLGSVSETLHQLSKSWQQRIPPIQCLVVNRQTGLPGSGVAWFLIDEAGYANLSLSHKRAVVKAELSHVFAYPSWRNVLAAFYLQPVMQQCDSLLSEAAIFRGGGESEAHRRLKEYVALHPKLVGLPASFPVGETEYPSHRATHLTFHFAETTFG